MCTEGHEEILEKLQLMETRLEHIESAQTHINKQMYDDNFIEGMRTAREMSTLVSTGKLDLLLRNGIADLHETVDGLRAVVFGNPSKGELGLSIIINGSEELGVEPLRKTLGRVALTHDRLLWLAGILGISTIGGLVGWVLYITSRGPVP